MSMVFDDVLARLARRGFTIRAGEYQDPFRPGRSIPVRFCRPRLGNCGLTVWADEHGDLMVERWGDAAGCVRTVEDVDVEIDRVRRCARPPVWDSR